ncbi:DUF368 domain-containing protein [Massiliimalia timonensis]|uniref:DUF368 domain-containing protein n=1 Tax=Massiliimalia timonensis TaxID=1987501 RepID=UPI00189CDF78|nr:DUF368 domain-containing protein [Massiliimalia timonensis]
MQRNRKKIIKMLIYFLQGALIGTGAILPGISGGVLCVAFGVYEPMMEFLVHPFRSFRKQYTLFLPILLGGLVGFVLLARVVESLFTASATVAIALFTGLICGTVPEMMRKSSASAPKKGWSCFVLTLVLSFIFFSILESGIESNIEANFFWYLFCGLIWGLSMVIPGLSSSSLLLFMGLYQPMTEGIGRLDLQVLVPLAIGFIVTILAASRVVNKLLKEHGTFMSRIILGFVLSSVLMIAPTSFTGTEQLLLSMACFAAGFLIARQMDLVKIKQRQE